MVEKKLLSKIWKRTIWHLIFACFGGIGIVIYLLFNSSKERNISVAEALFVFTTILAAAFLFFLFSLLIRNFVSKQAEKRRGE